MKESFDSLFYKIKDPVLEQKVNYIDHPADITIDYNSMIDFLEEEHLKREVFTTAVPVAKSESTTR